MSVTMVVFVKRSKMSSPKEWAKAIRANGFKMELDSDFDPFSHTGFLPCNYAGADAGFEYFLNDVEGAELPEEVVAELAGRDTVISFVTHSDFRELATSLIASGVLCSISDGLLWDTEADELISASEALEWARNGEASVKEELD